MCETNSANETIPELKSAAKYPGYSGCFSSCGGLLCGCFMPQPACTFYRVAQIPITKRVYEVTRCPHWSPEIKLEIEVNLFNKTRLFTQSFSPYAPVKTDVFNITVISIQKPASTIANKRFAISKGASFALPEHFLVAAECTSYREAQAQFHKCINRIRCECSNSVNNCLCPEGSISTLRNNSDTNLPLETPFGTLKVVSDEIIAVSNEEEVVIKLESKILQDSAEFQENHDCIVRATNVTGCYTCPTGAELTLTCESPKQMLVTALCEAQQFTLSCGANKSKQVRLSYEKSVVREECVLQCGSKHNKIVLTGNLYYHIHTQNSSIFDHQSHTVRLSHQWFADISMPDVSPLLETFTNHWKLTVAATIFTLMLAALTYIAGPIALIYVAKCLFHILKTLLVTTWSCLQRNQPERTGQQPIQRSADTMQPQASRNQLAYRSSGCHCCRVGSDPLELPACGLPAEENTRAA
ncbi:hypothetical protein RB195_024957 [Necator americanus]|uniref:Phlebovirus glycoprotein G2 fusion domain-containing protein n=1 Tax=Necator americanus TaxID=51031 RepID=A0ABR1EQB6_NECAM